MGIALLAALLGAVLAGCGTSGPAAPSANLGTQLDTAVPASVLNLPLTDPNGHPTSLAAYRGKIVVLGDAMTLCQEVCPLLAANFVQMARTLGTAGHAKDVVFVQLTIDPARDTPARLTAYRQLFRPAPANWVTLTGPATSIAKIWKYFGAGYDRVPEPKPATIDWWTGKPLTYDLQHSDVVVFLNPAQHERFFIDGVPNTSGNQPPAKLKKFLNARGLTNLNHPQAGDTWTVKDGFAVVNWIAGKQLAS